MNILLCTDNNYIQHCSVTMVSVLKNNKNVLFYIFSTDISLENKLFLQSLVEPYNSNVKIILIEKELLKDFPMSVEASSHISVSTYLRLFVEMKLPINVKKIIYLDSDIIVRNSLDELWGMSLENYAIGAVYQYNEWALGNNSYTRLGYHESYGYFNAGVLLINLDYWRINNVTRRLFDYVNKNYHNIISHDQDTLNAVLFQETYGLPCKFNILPFFFDSNFKNISFPRGLDYKFQINEELKNPTVLHFVFKPKPWDSGCSHKWRKEYYYYLDFTVWKGWRPKNKIKDIIQYRVLPFCFRKRRYFLQIINSILTK